MPGEKATVGVLVAPGEPMPPRIRALEDDARLELLRTAADLDRGLPELAVLAVYDFRTRLLHETDLSPAAQLRWIHAASAGVDAVMAPAVVESDIVVTNSRGVFDPGIAEYVLGLMLLFTKHFRTTLDLQREQRWQHRESLLLRGRELLVIGAGSIGTEIGRLSKAAGLHVSAVARAARDDDVFGRIHAQTDLHRLLPAADFVVVAAPLTRETRGLMDQAAFAAMKRGSWFINIGRGPIVDEPALLDALERGHLAGAALDVFVEEPLPPGHPFWTIPNVFVSPHMAGDVAGWEEELGALFVENFRRWQSGRELRNVVDKAREAAQQDATE